MRDVSRSSRNVARVAMDAAASGGLCSPDETSAAYGEVVWSWRRDPGVYPTCLCGLGNGDNKGRSPGRARISRKAIARGKPGCLGCTCQSRVLFSTGLSHTVLRAQSAPGFPCALCSEGATEIAKPGQSMPRDHLSVSDCYAPLLQKGLTMPAFVAAGAGFLLAVLWFDLMFDVQTRRHAHDAVLPPQVLGSISAYYRRVTTEAYPMNRL